MGEGPAPAVEAGHRHGIYLPLLDENQEAVQPRTPILRTGNPDVGMLGDDGPATGRRVLSEVEQLILNCLFFSVRLDLFRAHAGIQSHSHSRSPPPCRMNGSSHRLQVASKVSEATRTLTGQLHSHNRRRVPPPVLFGLRAPAGNAGRLSP